MAWHQPNNYDKNKDPWGDNKSDDNVANTKKDPINKHSDLDDMFNKITKKLSIFGKKSKNNNHKNKQKIYSKNFFIVVLIIATLTWIGSGFYTIKEAERGVINRFGKFHHIVQPGLNWRLMFIDQIQAVNVKTVRELATSGVMLTSDENVVRVEMNVQYRVIDPANYLYSVTNADDSLRQATDSALRGVIGRSTMDRILTEGRTIVRTDTQKEIEKTIRPYNMGIMLLDVNFQAARPPEEVKAAFDDAIAARENREQYVREAEAYANEVQPYANGQAQRILEEARAYKQRTVLQAQGEVERFIKILPEYKASPKITKERLYIDTMERVLKNTNKILVNDSANKMMVLPLNELIKNKSLNQNFANLQNNQLNEPSLLKDNDAKNNLNILPPKNIMDQRRIHSMRNDIQRKERIN